MRYDKTIWVAVAFAAGLFGGCERRQVQETREMKVPAMKSAAVWSVSDRVNDIACQRDGRLIAVAAVAKPIILVLDAMTGKESFALPCDVSSPLHVAFSPKGNYIAAGCSGGIEVWDVARRAAVATLHRERFNCSGVAFSQCGRHVYAAMSNPEALLWCLDIETGQSTVVFDARRHSPFPKSDGEDILCFAMCQETSIMAFSLSGGTILLDASSKRVLRAIPSARDPAIHMRFSPDGRVLAIVTSKPNIELWDVRKGEKLATCVTALVTALSFSPDGRLLASAGEGRPYEAGSIDIWEVESHKRLGRFAAHESVILGLAFLPGTSKVITGSDDGTVQVWDLTELASTDDRCDPPPPPNTPTTEP